MPIDHSSHDHPATSAARSACRKAMSSSSPVAIAVTMPTVSTTPASKPRKARRPSRYKDVVVPHTEAVKPDSLSDEDWNALLRNRARFTKTPYPTAEERAAALADITAQRTSGIPNVPASDPYVAPARSTAQREASIAERKAEAARDAGSQLPTFANARALAGDIPAGRYAIRNGEGEVEFYKIDKPTEGKWANYVFLKIMASDTEYPIKSAARQMSVYKAILEVTPAAASRAYGVEIGHCGVCGRTLTDNESIAAGIGPVCAAKLGW